MVEDDVGQVKCCPLDGTLCSVFQPDHYNLVSQTLCKMPEDLDFSLIHLVCVSLYKGENDNYLHCVVLQDESVP